MYRSFYKQRLLGPGDRSQLIGGLTGGLFPVMFHCMQDKISVSSYFIVNIISVWNALDGGGALIGVGALIRENTVYAIHIRHLDKN